MISVVIPTLNAAQTLPETLAALVPAALEGLVREVVIADGGSRDGTLAIAEDAGARIVACARGRGRQLRAGAEAARGPWLLFLHADTVIERGFESELAAFCQGARHFAALGADRAAAFRFALDDDRPMARLMAIGVRARCSILRLPYGDQGLVLARGFYDRIGGFRDLELMEDVDIVRRIGRRRLTMLRANAVTSAERYRAGGYMQRIARNWLCLTLFYLGVAPGRIARLYG